MTAPEIASAQPLRLKVVEVKRGDTVEKFAKRMGVADRPAERFRVPNGLGAKDRRRPGQLVKLVV